MLPLDLAPMLAKPAAGLPSGAQWHFEPKWDGFRCLVHRRDDEIQLISRSGKPLARYFPDVVSAAWDLLPPGLVLDGELVVPQADRLDWDALSARVHPAASRVDLLAQQTPAMFVAFDLLHLDQRSLLPEPFEVRRDLLVDTMKGVANPRWRVTTATRDARQAQEWFERFEGAGLDGIVAKDLTAPYTPGTRAMVKVKHRRTADVVVIGMRPHKASTDEAPLVGALRLGLQTPDGLRPVGGCTAFPMAERARLAVDLAPLVSGSEQGSPNRWTSGRSTEWITLRPERVVEVAYDQLEGDRFRHTATFLRWRPDRDPASCGWEQLHTPPGYSLAEVLDA
jgi:ATP-dependent DNA ligase